MIRLNRNQLGYVGIAIVLISLLIPTVSYPFFTKLAGWLTFITIIIFFPLSFISKLRRIISYCFLFSSFVFGTFALLLAQVLTEDAPFSPLAIVWEFFANMTLKYALNLIFYILLSIYCARYSNYLDTKARE